MTYSKDFIKRFWQKVDKKGPVPAHKPELGPCWLWARAKNKRGYATVAISYSPKRVRKGAHRVALEISLGYELPPEVDACHHCDNPSCVRDTHLFAGTVTDNMKDMWYKERRSRREVAETNPKAKLTWKEVRELRLLRTRENKTAKELADLFGISTKNCHKILAGKIWREAR